MKKIYSILSIIALMAPPTAVAQSGEAAEEVVFDFMDRTSFGLCTSKSYEKVREEEDYYGRTARNSTTTTQSATDSTATISPHPNSTSRQACSTP